MDSRLVIVVADTHPVVRWALCSYLDAKGHFRVVAQASSRGELEMLSQQYRPDVVVTELHFPDGHVAESMPALSSRTNVLAFSVNDSWDCVQSFFDSGGTAFVSKRSALHDVSEAIRAAARNQRWVDPSIRQVSYALDRPPTKDDTRILTPREREIVALIAKGYTGKQIAEQLCISSKTVETHRYRVFRKLNIRRCAQLTDYAIRHGLG